MPSGDLIPKLNVMYLVSSYLVEEEVEDISGIWANIRTLPPALMNRAQKKLKYYNVYQGLTLTFWLPVGNLTVRAAFPNLGELARKF